MVGGEEMSKKKKEERKFQLDLLQVQVRLEGMLALFIGLLAIEYTLVTYYGMINHSIGQLVSEIWIIVTPIGFYFWYKDRFIKAFKSLESKYIKD